MMNDTVVVAKEMERSAPENKSNHLMISFGLSNYLGDLGGNSGAGNSFLKDNNLKQRTFIQGISFYHLRSEAVGIRLGYSFGKLAGSDADATYKSINDAAYYRFKRNLNFRTNISEFSIISDVYPLKLVRHTLAAHHWDFQPYASLGIGLFHFNPQGTYYDEISEDDVWVDLHPLRTEGQGTKQYPFARPYKLTQWNIPFGIGCRYTLSEKTSLSFEFIGRKLFTDYLDDVSGQFVDPAVFDTYLSGEQAEIAKAIHNKSNHIDPDSPYRPGGIRGNPNKYDFFYSFNLRFTIRLSKIK
jgi:hypothetical protein